MSRTLNAKGILVSVQYMKELCAYSLKCTGVYFGTLYFDNSQSALLAPHDITEITLLAYPLSSRLLFEK